MDIITEFTRCQKQEIEDQVEGKGFNVRHQRARAEHSEVPYELRFARSAVRPSSARPPEAQSFAGAQVI